MVFNFTRRISRFLLPVYWLLIFILTHVSLRPELLRQIQASDKALHFLVYFILFFLIRFSFIASEKINWRKKGIWVLLSVVIIYSAVDELLQPALGRNPDFFDFMANAGGLLGGIFIFSFFSFMKALLIFFTCIIFVITLSAGLRFEGLLFYARAVLYFLSFTLLSVVWNLNLSGNFLLKSSSIKSLVKSFIYPFIILGAGIIFSNIVGNPFHFWEIVFSMAGILCVIIALIFFRQKSFSQSGP